LNPFMPFITEELYESMAVRDKSSFLFTSKWPDYTGIEARPEAERDIKWVLKFISDIRSVRSDMNVPAGARLDLLIKGSNAESDARLKTYDEILRRMARLNSIEKTSVVPKGSLQSILEESTLILPVADIIDLDKERARLQKEIEKLSSEISKLDQRLANQDFISKADPETIEEQKTRKIDAEQTAVKLKQAIEQLSVA
jgi:valyl-tRNA synthetase